MHIQPHPRAVRLQTKTDDTERVRSLVILAMLGLSVAAAGAFALERDYNALRITKPPLSILNAVRHPNFHGVPFGLLPG